MYALRFCGVLALLSLSICLESGRAEPEGADHTATTGEPEIKLGIGGVGGVYFLASPGQLTVDLEKRDRNRRGGQAELRAILVGPDRHVLDEVTIPDDGQGRGAGVGPVQRTSLSAPVDRKGIYGLNVTVSQDRYGDDIIWGFRTNCPYYLIETSRGHRDERRQEPIVLLNPERPADVCFLPRRDAFAMEITAVPDGVATLPVYDCNGTLVHTLPVDGEGRASFTFPADVHRDAQPWRLHLPKQQATIQIDGVTRWDKQDLHPNLPYWTPDLESYFPFLDYRWILTPYSRMVYGRPGEQREVAFQVHNNSSGKRTIRLSVEFPNTEWPARLSEDCVRLEANGHAEVMVRCTVPESGQTRVCHVRATPAEDPRFSTYSTLTVTAGIAPAEDPVEIPIVLKPYRHENQQFGYLPDYPVQSQVYFDLDNRPFVSTANGVSTWRDGRWNESNLQTSAKLSPPSPESTPMVLRSTKVAFDKDNHLYLLASAGGEAVLVHSRDRGLTFTGYVIPSSRRGSGTLDLEQFSGHNVPDGPPPIVRFTRTEVDPRLKWRRVNDLELFVPEKVNGRVSPGDPILISKRCIGLSAHSGIPSSVVSRGSKVHVVWAEATEPDAEVPGVPTYVVTYDRRSGKLGQPVLVGYGAPPNDVHNSPSITMDSQGYLHVLAGTHGRPFQYARSLQPSDAHSGWTEAVPVGEGLRQTYIGLVCGPDDTLHLAYRLWQYGSDPFPASHHAVLAYQQKRPGQPWEAPQALVVPPFSEYSIYYHRLTIDRAGRLFLSYDYWSTYWFYRTDHRGHRRALLMSPDSGQTWQLQSRDRWSRPVDGL